jgi:protein-S-isoprenylcysteine O-methyltransferase Ste14
MRTFWITFGLATHVLFGVMVWCLFPFLRGLAADAEVPGVAWGWWMWDLLLAGHFGVLHSLLLWRGTRRRLERFIPGPLYGCFFSLVTCVSLLLIIFTWQPSGIVLGRVSGAVGIGVSGLYLFGWGLLFYSLSMYGLGYQTGWVPYFAYLRGRKPPPRTFEPRGIYHLLRHPVYLSLLVIVWSTPVLTADRLLLNLVWTGYIFVGSYLKDERLAFYLGDLYRRYQARVPGYPFIGFGPLARVPHPAPEAKALPRAVSGHALETQASGRIR